MRTLLGGSAVVLLASAGAFASPTLQFDLNAFSTQSQNASHVNSAFGGLNHTGSVNFSLGQGVLNGLFISTTPGGPFSDAGFAGFTWTSMTGEVDLVNGHVTGGNIAITLNNGDRYSCNITPNVGSVSTFVGGGFKIEALTRQGAFNANHFGNVSVAPWFNAQNGLSGLPGSFLQFNFNPNATGFASSDMDLFVDVIPLPPAGWAGLCTLAIAAVIRRTRK